jgi:Fe-S cluster biogenesis protein NfuA
MTSISKESLYPLIENALESIRPHLRVDGGDVEFIELTDDYIVKIKWLGACESCSMSFITMRAGLEDAIKGKIPQINGVEAINGVKI